MKRIIILAIISLISFSGIAQSKDSVLTNIIGWTHQEEYFIGTKNALKDIKLPALTFKEMQDNNDIYYLLVDPTNTLPYSIKFTKSGYDKLFDFSNCWGSHPNRIRVQLITNEGIVNDGNFEIYKSGDVVRFNWSSDIRQIQFIQNNYFECNAKDWYNLNNVINMKIGFAPCGFTSEEIINKLRALGGINRGYDPVDLPTSLYWYIDSRSGNIQCDTANVLDVRLNPNDIPEKINQMADLPTEMRRLVVLRQLKAGNPVDLSKFDKDRSIGTKKGGFEWWETPEKSEFWKDFLYNKKYYLYYTLNIKKDETELQDKTASIGRSEDITGSGIRCERRKPTIASGHLRDRKAIKC